MKDSRSRRLRDHSHGPATLISEGCKIKGLITGDGDFLINGEVDGDCDLGGTVTLSNAGRWYGTISAGNVIVSGVVEGDVIAAEKIEITATAHITGTVSAESIAVAEGAIVVGEMKTSGKARPVKFVEKRDAE